MPRKAKVHVNTRKLPRTHATFMRSGLCALLPLTERSQCHCLLWLLGTRRLFDSRTRYTLEICHFPCFFHELSVPKGNATYNTEYKHGGRVLSKWKRQDVPNLMDSQHGWGENRNIFYTFYSILLKLGRVNKHKWSYFPWLRHHFSLHRIDVMVFHVPTLETFDFYPLTHTRILFS